MQQPGLFNRSPIAQAPVARATVEDGVLLASIGFFVGVLAVLALAAWVAGAAVIPTLGAWLKTVAWASSGHVLWPELGPVLV